MEYYILLIIVSFLLGIFLQKLINPAHSKCDAYLHVVELEEGINLLLQVNKEPDNFKDGQIIRVKVVRK